MLAAAWPWEWSASAWSSLTFVVLVVAAVLTWRQVKEAQRVREDQSRPFVLIDFLLFEVAIEIRIANIGSTLARDVRFEFDRPLESTQDGNDWKVGALNIVTSGIPSLAPGREIPLFFDLFPARIKAGLPLTYSVQVSYSDAYRKRRYSEQMVLDLEAFLGTGAVTRNGLHEVHKELKSIATTIHRWSDRSGLKVLTRADIRARDVDFVRQREERRAQAEQAASDD